MAERVLRVLMIGAGGHARVCAEALRDDADHSLIGALSHDGRGIERFDVPVVGLDADLEPIWGVQVPDRFFVAIGDNAARAMVTRRCDALGATAATAVSRFAMVSRTAEVGPGSALLPGSVVNAAATIGRGAIVNTNASVDHDCVVGEFVHIAPGVAVCGGVRIGDGTMIGVGARIAPNVTVGARVVVGAGAVVLRDVADGAMVAGVPARTAGGGTA